MADNCTNPATYYGHLVFNDQAMRNRLPQDTYEALQKTLRTGKALPPETLGVIANAMKDWAIEKGCTHYTHWFLPLSGVSAGKQDSFISPLSPSRVIMRFGPEALFRGEPDASALPNGGLRVTFEARGYTAWDPMSYAFVRGRTLYIPTAFCSFNGEALDDKTPLLRSMDALNRQALRLLSLFQVRDVRRVTATVGAEQEYFLIDQELFDERRDLKECGRTLFGLKPLKGQELCDHYFGTIKPRVAAFMDEVNQSLWALGIPAKTQHQEAAPGQFELAPIYEPVNIACDHNRLTMEVLQETARKHGFVCLLHEKPYQGLNGSGKHNNYSLVTDTGKNLLAPGDTPAENAQFLLFLCAMMKAVDEHADLMRLATASLSNDRRLGGFEAPPAIVSMYLGDELMDILDALVSHRCYVKEGRCDMSIGVHVLPPLPVHSSDRNRTAPVAFTGDKFEFRMPGASQSLSEINTIINTALAEALSQFADTLESAEDFHLAREALIIDCIKKHSRVLYQGNAYGADWLDEARQRGLPQALGLPEALGALKNDKGLAVMDAHKVLSPAEIASRYEIKAEIYCRQLLIEAGCLAAMAQRSALPAAMLFGSSLTENLIDKQKLLGDVPAAETDLIRALNEGVVKGQARARKLDEILKQSRALTAWDEKAHFLHDQALPQMESLRVELDKLEALMPPERWPFPALDEMLQSANS